VVTPTDPDDASAGSASGPDPAPGPTPAAGAHYRRPGWFTRNVFNPAVAGLTRLGVSVWGSRVLEVPGRRSGEPRRTPVNLLTVDGREYLVSPRGHTQWILNVRANEGRLDLLVGSRRTSYVATELADADKPDVLRAYLERWKAEVGVFFDGVDAGSSDEDLLAQAPKHPVFALEPAEAPAAPG
jgi:deazaflavin-dependent oxidoreductase (nitroreductase family)